MKENQYDLAVAYRIYPQVSSRVNAPVFNNDKYKLAKICLKSFKDALGSLRAKIWALLDNCPSEYEDLFKKYFNKEGLELIVLEGIGNYPTFGLQIEILSNQTASEIVYFAEDDYYYFPNEFEKMISFLKHDDEVDFITPFDHLDYYNYILHNHKRKFKEFAGKTWKTINSTCLTFLTTKKTLQKTQKILNLYANEVAGDASTWLCLTKFWVFHPLKLLRFYFKNHFLFIIIAIAIRHGWKQILFGKRYKLWCPVPTIAAHMVRRTLPPNIDWDNIFKKAIENLD